MPKFSIYRVVSMEFDRALHWDRFLLTVRAQHAEMAEERGFPEIVTVFQKGPGNWTVHEELPELLRANVIDLAKDYYLANTPRITEQAATCSCGDAENYSLNCPVHGIRAAS